MKVIRILNLTSVGGLFTIILSRIGNGIIVTFLLTIRLIAIGGTATCATGTTATLLSQVLFVLHSSILEPGFDLDILHLKEHFQH